MYPAGIIERYYGGYLGIIVKVILKRRGKTARSRIGISLEVEKVIVVVASLAQNPDIFVAPLA